VKYVLDKVIDEIIDYRQRRRFNKSTLYLLITLYVVTTLIMFQPWINIVYVTIYCFTISITLLVLGLRRTFLYATFSFMLILGTMLPIGYILKGDLVKIYRFSLTAYSTLSIGVLILLCLNPSLFKGNIYIYIFLIILNQVIREVRDVVVVYRSRGLSGLKLYVRAVLISMIMAFTRLNTLLDSLKARGFQVE